VRGSSGLKIFDLVALPGLDLAKRPQDWIGAWQLAET
jgi:hypothetical protein